MEALQLRPGVSSAAASARAAVVMRRWTPADQKSKSLPLPAELDALLSADTDRDNTRQMWAAFRSCYASESEAIQAAKRNTGTILPYLNSPGNIYGSYAYIVEELGLAGAREVCKQNPGVLQCDPRAIRQSSGEDIRKAANVIDNFESLKLPPLVRWRLKLRERSSVASPRAVLLPTFVQVRNNLDKVLFLAGASFVAKRIFIDCADRACGGSLLL